MCYWRIYGYPQAKNGAKLTKLRKANQSDSKSIFEWRNDELTRQMSHTTDLIKWDEHCNWFTLSLADPNKLLVICEDEATNEKVAIVSFDVKGARALISINVSPEFRGKGKAKTCLENSISFFETIHSSVKFISAEIKTINVVSQQSFLGVGFIFLKEIAGISYYEYVI